MKKLLCVWAVAAFGFAAVTSAVQPIPDYYTLVFPTLVPKAGHSSTPPADAQPNTIRGAYDTTYESYWRETSYHQFDPDTGAGTRGYFNDPKTYGYFQMPWPIAPRGAYNRTRFGRGDTFWDGNDPDHGRLYSSKITVVPDAADSDGNWTPGESFRDVDGNGQWDPCKPGEDFWNSGNTANQPAAPGLYSTLANAWDNQRGEFYADYDLGTDLASGNVDFDPSVSIWVRFGTEKTNTQVTISEQNLSLLTRGDATIEGDFVHTYIQAGDARNPAVPCMNFSPTNVDAAITPTIPLNNLFDFNQASDGTPLVSRATNRFNGQAVSITFSQLYVDGDFGETEVYVGTYPYPTNVTVKSRQIVVPVYQSGELFGNRRAVNPTTQAFGDGTAANVANRTIAVDQRWTDGSPAEPFEDFLSWGNHWVAELGNPRGRPAENAISRATYDRYLLWNYPGAAAALVARAGNGVYDGPESWVDAENNKLAVNWSDSMPAGPTDTVALEPLDVIPGDHWDNRFFATWQDWWLAAFGGAAPVAGHYYEFVTTPSTWVAASNAAALSGGYLVKIDDAAENEAISTRAAALFPAAAMPAMWLGADQSVALPWHWQDGTLLTYTNWAKGAPVSTAVVAAATMAYATDVDLEGTNIITSQRGQWFDRNRNLLLPYVIEYDIPPPGVALTIPPAWKPIVPVLTAYTPNNGGGAGTWIPATTWSFDSEREFCDMASSIYHLDGDPASAVTPLTTSFYDNTTKRSYTWASGLFGGDNAVGEVTSPFNDLDWGEDRHPETATGASPAGPDGSVSPASPFAYNIHGISGFDAGNQRTMEILSWWTDGVPGLDTHTPQFKDTNLDGVLDIGQSRTGDPMYTQPGGDGQKNTFYPWTRERFMEDVIEAWDQSENFSSFARSDNGARIPLYGFPIYPGAIEGQGGWSALGGTAGANITVLTRDDPVPYNILFQARPLSATGEQGATPPGGGGHDTGYNSSGFVMGLLCHEQGHDIQGWPDLYDYDVWTGGQEPVNTPMGAYDLMAGGMVHGCADLKESAGWVSLQDLRALVPVGSRVTINMYPVEDFPDQYYRLANTNFPGEFMDFWFTRNDTSFGVAGGPGVYVSHVDRYAYDSSLPRQQRINNHFVWEMVQADGLEDLGDGINSGDGGDPFPGTLGNRTFSADSDPAALWYNGANDEAKDIGLRMVNIESPISAGEPARVTFERYDPADPWGYSTHNMPDADGDGIADLWEWHWFGALDVANSSSDFDRDGLADRGEYLAHTNPRNNSDIASTDASDDRDGDSVNNLAEYSQYGTDPYDPDSDDDGLSDGEELNPTLDKSGWPLTSPVDSRSPTIQRAMVLNGTPLIESGVIAGGRDWLALSEWTVEAWVYLDSDHETGVVLERRTEFGQTTFAITVSNNIPYAEFTTDGGTRVRAGVAEALPANTWVHLAIIRSAADRSLTLLVDGIGFRSQATVEVPSYGGVLAGTTRFGEGVHGRLDELRVWSQPRTQQQVSTNRFYSLNWPQAIMASGGNLVANYRFDDEQNTHITNAATGLVLSHGAEDSVHPLNWDYAITGATFGVGMALMGEDDEDKKGMPDWWETMFIGAINQNPTQDLDGDGMNNLHEYYCRTNPKQKDSDNDGLQDDQEDYDGDGLNNLNEQTRGTDPRLPDTDDDAIADGDEVVALTDPLIGSSPFTNRHVLVDGADTSFVEFSRDARFALKSWTVEAMVYVKNPLHSTIIGRQLQPGIFNYWMGVTTSGVFSTGFTAKDDPNLVFIQSAAPVPTQQWVHVRSTFSDTNGLMRLFVNGVQVATTNTARRPQTSGTGPVITGVGAGFNGAIDEVRIWSVIPPTNLAVNVPFDTKQTNLVAYLRFDDTSNTNGTSGISTWDWGQVQDFGVTNDWKQQWRNSATLYGAALLTDLFEVIDSDHDGLPAAWEALYGLNPNDPNGANGAAGDPDGDGVPNLDEYIADTNPTNSLSRLAIIQEFRQTNQVMVRWTGGQAATQYVEQATLLSGTPLWQIVHTSVPPTAVTNELLRSNPTNSAIEFFRIKAGR